MALRPRHAWVLVCLLGAVLAVFMLRLPIIGKPARFTYAVSREQGSLSAAARRVGYEPVELSSAEGHKLLGMLRKPSAEQAAWLLFFPGNAEGQLGGAFDLVERLRAGRDLGVLVCNYRGFDGSEGEPSPRAAAEDATAQLRYLAERHGVKPEQLTLAGYSMGSGIALGLAAQSQRQASPVRGLLLLSPYTWLTVAPVSFTRRLLEVDRYDALEDAPTYLGPTLVLAGSKDEPLPIREHAHKLVKALGGQVRYVELAGRGHVDYLGDDAALSPAVAFVMP